MRVQLIEARWPDELDTALSQNPDYIAHRFNYAAALRQLGLVQRDRGASVDAMRAFRRSIDVFASLPADQPKRTGSVSLWRDARTTLQQALEGWQAYQKGAGAKEDLRDEIDAVIAALAQVERSLGTR